MRNAIILAGLLACSSAVLAADATCMARAAEKKLAGAAKTSFLGKCEKDLKAGCEAAATEKKLAGAARNSHVNKCVRDGYGEPEAPAETKPQ